MDLKSLNLPTTKLWIQLEGYINKEALDLNKLKLDAKSICIWVNKCKASVGIQSGILSRNIL